MRMFKCSKCNKIIEIVKKGTDKPLCCNQEMEEIIPNSHDAATEKHVPIYSIDDGKIYVRVGETIHPMENNHYISLIIAETKDAIKRKELKPGDEPEALFDYEEGMKLYAYCNVHGLWETLVKE